MWVKSVLTQNKDSAQTMPCVGELVNLYGTLDMYMYTHESKVR